MSDKKVIINSGDINCTYSTLSELIRDLDECGITEEYFDKVDIKLTYECPDYPIVQASWKDIYE